MFDQTVDARTIGRVLSYHKIPGVHSGEKSENENREGTKCKTREKA